ncbi:hypothetical protein ACWGI8_16450 [Streptomyces sp. NPDC054841]
MHTHLTHVHAPDGVLPATGRTRAVTGPGRLPAASGRIAYDGSR